jgi:hypothetical protein
VPHEERGHSALLKSDPNGCSRRDSSDRSGLDVTIAGAELRREQGIDGVRREDVRTGGSVHDGGDASLAERRHETTANVSAGE